MTHNIKINDLVELKSQPGSTFRVQSILVQPNMQIQYVLACMTTSNVCNNMRIVNDIDIVLSHVNVAQLSTPMSQLWVC